MVILKVFGFGLIFVEGKQYRGIVATTSKSKAAKAFGVSYYTFNEYGGETENEDEISLAVKYPGTVFITSIDDYSKNYKKLK